MTRSPIRGASSSVDEAATGHHLDDGLVRTADRADGPRSSVGLRRHHLPALDGLRAVAVCAVIAYHLQFGWAGGGYLGVDVFFVLSGFLITGLLTEEQASSGGISLPRFWARRARRLLPGLVLVLGAISVCSAVGNSALNRATLPGDMVATLFYYANWHFIAGHSSYFAQFLVPSPLEHAWSLAIEEQFYLVWPVLLLLLVRLGGRSWRRTAVVLTAVLAIGSVVDMAVVAKGATDVTRAYFGTDTRAFELMVGALLALWLEQSRRTGGARPWVRLCGWAASAGLVAAFGLVGGPPRWMFDGGFLGVALLTAIVLVNVARAEPGGLGSVLSLRPLRWIGRISYGLYLWHWPVFVMLSTATTALPAWAVDVARLAVTFAAATLSFYLVEEPIRRGAYRGARSLTAGAPVAAGLVLVAATVFASGSGVAASAAPLSGIEAKGSPVFPLTAVPTAQRRLRVLLIGDSEMQYAAPGIEAALDATGVVTTSSAAYPGWGLTADHSWRTDLTKAVRELRPEVVIGTWSWDKGDAARHPAAYTRLLESALRTLRAPGNGVEGVVFVQFPVVGSSHGASAADTAQTNQELRRWNAIVQAEAERNPGWVGYLPVAGSVELNGAYSSWLPGAAGHLVRARTTDGFHMCPGGAARYADAILTDLEAWWSLPKPIVAWWKAGWVQWSGYGYGLCPY